MKLLLHICCAPCSIYVIDQCRDAARKIPADSAMRGFYFNPNIHPRDEYLRRRAALEEYTEEVKLDVIYPEYKPEYFFEKIEDRENKPERCRACWRMRLEETALFAGKNGFDSFTTTLLISPYQEHMAIKEIGLDLAGKHNIEFYYRDFRPGFRESQAEAKRRNLYRQKYCGCKYSENHGT